MAELSWQGLEDPPMLNYLLSHPVHKNFSQPLIWTKIQLCNVGEITFPWASISTSVKWWLSLPQDWCENQMRQEGWESTLETQSLCGKVDRVVFIVHLNNAAGEATQDVFLCVLFSSHPWCQLIVMFSPFPGDLPSTSTFPKHKNTWSYASRSEEFIQMYLSTFT